MPEDPGVIAHNRDAWDKLVKKGNPWTVPVSSAEVEAARKGEWEIYLTEKKPLPREWFPTLSGARVLCLASGGGQQGPIMAAAGAAVTVFDNAPEQLVRDDMVAARDGLEIQTVLGDMADLSVFSDSSFDLILHPVSNIFAPDIIVVWREAFRVLRGGGALISGIVNPVEYSFDMEKAEAGTFEVKYPLPYSDVESISEEERVRIIGADEPYEFSHTLEEQIGGQIAAGFVITGFFEDYRREEKIAEFLPSYIVTKASKLVEGLASE